MTDNEIKKIKDSLRTCTTKGDGCKGCMYEGNSACDCREKLAYSIIGVIEYEQERAEYYAAKCKEIMFAKSAPTVGKLLPIIEGNVMIQRADGSNLTGDAQTLLNALNHEMLSISVGTIFLTSGTEPCATALTLLEKRREGDA